MSEQALVEKFRSQIDADDVHDEFGMTSEENAIFTTRPSVFAFFAKYILCFTVLIIHLLFWWINALEGNAGTEVSGTTKVAIAIVDALGITGFVVVMLALTWINRFMNWSSSGRWYTTSLLLITMTPLAFVLENFIVWGLDIFGSSFQGVLPNWDDAWYLILGVGYFSVLLLLTVLYSRSFKYAISDRCVYLKKDFMLNKTSHSIDLIDIDNLKLNQPWYATILGFGTVNLLTGSGFGVKHESVSVSTGIVTDAASTVAADVGFLRKIFRGIIFMTSLQRTREVMNSSEPEDCIYGVRKPSEIERLVRGLQQERRNPSANKGSGALEPERLPVQQSAGPEPAAEADSLDELDVDMDLD